MNPSVASDLRRESAREMAILRSRYKKVTPVPLPEKAGCRNCGTVSPIGGKFHLCILHRGEKDEAIVAVAVLCPACYDSPDAEKRILSEAWTIYRRAFA